MQHILLYLCTAMKRVVYILLMMVLLATGGRVNAQTTGDDSIRVSLLTCGPGTEIYNLFGHTAIRYQDLRRGIDYAFNYGMFSFDTPNFVLRFTLGETDYQLGVEYTADFVAHYRYNNRDVREQVLNMTTAEKQRLYSLLVENYQPENRTYRYNFFFDNCSTRPRDKIEQCVTGGIAYQEDMQTTETGESFRSMVHQYTKDYRWSQFGIDLLLGSKADKPISRREMMFLPLYLEQTFNGAQRADSLGHEKPLVQQENVLNTAVEPEATALADVPTPMRVTLLLLTIVIAATIYGIRRRKSLWGLDLTILFIYGVAGCILAFMGLFSQHPDVDANYLLFIFHPFHLVFMPWALARVRKLRLSRYMLLNFVVLTFFIILWGAIPQEFNPAVLPLALCLWVRSASNIVLSYRKPK